MHTGLFKKTPLLILFLIILTFTAYSFILGASFKTMDDEFAIVNNEQIRDFANIGKVLSSSFFGEKSYYRPLVSISHMIEYHFFGLNPLFYYLTNIFIHIATALSLWGIMHIIFRRQLLAFSVAILFAIHPIHWEAVSNIPGRAILLCAFFYVNAFLLFCVFQENTKRKGVYVLSLFSFSLALTAKESAGILPLILTSYQFFIKRRPEEKSLHWFSVVLPFFFFDAVYILVRRFLGIMHVYHWRYAGEAVLGFVTFLRSVITHLRLLVLPVDLQFDRSLKMFDSIFSGEVLLTIIFFIILGLLIIRYRTKLSAEAKFFVSWFFIELIPVSQIVASIGVQPGYISTAEHFLYTPSIGFFALLGLCGVRLYQKNKHLNIIQPAVFLIILIAGYSFFFLSTIQHNIYSANEIAMFERTLQLNPHNSRIHNSLGLAYAELNRFKEAEQHFRKALEENPFNVRARVGLGKALGDQGKLWEGIQEYEKIQNAGKFASILEGNLAATLEGLIQKYQAMLDEAPDDPQVHYSLGVVYSKTQQINKAVVHYTKAVVLKPDFKNALFNLGSSYEALGQWEMAVIYYEKMLGLNESRDNLDDHAVKQLEEIYQKSGDTGKANTYNK